MKNEDKLIMSRKVNLASPKAGAKIIDVSDDFFAKCDRMLNDTDPLFIDCLLYTSPSPRDGLLSRMPSSA